MKKIRVFIFIIEGLNYYGKTIKRRWMISIFFWYKQYLNHDISKGFLSYKYCEISNGRQLNKYSLKLIKAKYKLYNLGINIKSQTGNATKKVRVQVVQKKEILNKKTNFAKKL
ncbi:hypothetical protein [Metamycoplasma hominis]|uniref:hypothetical protein n=1 Tax=Metamycoplasma hominis TaxID=2098 RepID=UPI002411324F|nr:hypothetical protein [Metamycoplasma hominis]